MVVSVGGSPQVPVTQAISAGNDVELLLEFTPASYIVADDDLTVDNESVTVSIVEGSTNLVELSVASGTPAGETFALKFRQQVIVNGSVTSAKFWPEMIFEAGDDVTNNVVLSGFEFPYLDESAKAIVKMTSDTYDVDLEFDYQGPGSLVCTSDLLPDVFADGLELVKQIDGRMFVSASNEADKTYTLHVLSFDMNGQQIYP